MIYFELNLFFPFQICFYFHLKFKSMNVKLRKLRDSKRNVRIRLRIYMIITEHNSICKTLKQFNNFWKFCLQTKICFFLFLEWFLIYEVSFDPKLILFNKLFFSAWLIAVSSILSCFIFIIYIVSTEVILPF